MTAGPERAPSRPPVDWLVGIEPGPIMAANVAAVRANGKVRIYCGEAHFRVYGKEFAEAVGAAKRREASTYVITGPVLVTDLVVDGVKDHYLLQLHRSGAITKLIHRPSRGATGSYHLVDAEDGYRLYKERARSPEVPRELRHYLDMQGLALEEVQRDIDRFDRFLAYLERTPSRGSNLLPILLTDEEHRDLSKTAAATGTPIDYLDPLQICALPGAAEMVGIKKA